ncbi:MAG: ATP-binding protein [Pseudomonadota bacterium]|nr:ATP-binding protein [Pseudomonadota bacterium]
MPLPQPKLSPSERNEKVATPAYFVRRLRPHDEGMADFVDEAGLIGVPGAKVVLGEPGMGKSELLRELGRRLDIEPVSAIRFLLSKKPERFVTPGKPLLIDGLDEAMARRERDSVDAVLAQLEDAGSPDFVLSCRSREWQARGESNLRQLYGADPKLFSLEPLHCDEAAEFLASRHPGADVTHVLSHLDAHGLSDLYRNPLTLGLMGRVAETDTALPASRGALFQRVCTLIWSEHNLERQDLGLAQLTEADALSSVGAVCAALLLGGAEAVSIAGAAELHERDLRIADIALLPGAGAAPTVFSSKLFQSFGSSRIKPIHRVIAEYLGARWLARQVDSPRKQRRLLAQLQGSGGVPASLRGLHAWLAYHGPALAEHVIAADPYGVLRYGEPNALSLRQAEILFHSLEALARDNPWFRSNDWDSRTAAGLMVPGLKPRIDAVIGSAESNAHLRSLLIEGLNGSPLAGELADSLEAVVISPVRFYREREDAAEALLPYRGREWWRATIQSLLETPGEDAGRLARRIIERIKGDVADGILVSAVFAELGLLTCAWPRVRKQRVHTLRYFKNLVALITTERLAGILDQLVDFVELVPKDDWQSVNDIAGLTSELIVRAIDEGAVATGDGARLWRWFGVIERASRFHRDTKETLKQRLEAKPELRRAAQSHALYIERRRNTIWMAEFDLDHRMLGLSSYRGDVAWHLEQMAAADLKDEARREDWRDLMRIGRRADGFDQGVREAGEKFMRGDKQLAAYLTKLESPKPLGWERRRARETSKRERKERVSIEFDRRHYAANVGDMRAGKLKFILGPARAYLGHDTNLPGQGIGAARVEAWLGSTLGSDALTGFEAALHRADLPSIADVTKGFAEGTTYNYGFVIIAGLTERMANGRGFAGVPSDVLTIGLLLLHFDGG